MKKNNRFKITITAVLIALTLEASTQRAHSSALALGGFCVATALGAVAGVVYLYSCNDKSWCVRLLNDQGQPEGPWFCLEMKCARDAAANGVRIYSGPYKRLKTCVPNCDTNNFPALTFPAPDMDRDGPQFPMPFSIAAFDEFAGTMHVLRSANPTAGPWEEVDAFEATPEFDVNGEAEFFFHRELTGQPTDANAFYRLMWVPGI